jgi:hypothetical protein
MEPRRSHCSVQLAAVWLRLTPTSDFDDMPTIFSKIRIGFLNAMMYGPKCDKKVTRLKPKTTRQFLILFIIPSPELSILPV